MERLIEQAARSLVRGGVTSTGNFVLCALDRDCVCNEEGPRANAARAVMKQLGIGAFIHGKPSFPVPAMIRFLCAQTDMVYPRDSETRTFLHRLPVCDGTPSSMAEALRGHRAALCTDGTVIASGMVSPQEAAVNFSSACFSVYVKFMTDCLTAASSGAMSPALTDTLSRVLPSVRPLVCPSVQKRGPFDRASQVISAMVEAGRLTVECGLVDSCFGNISFVHDGILYISQTGAALDELDGCIDPCPLDDSGGTITASSEYLAHLGIVRKARCDGVLHGHPKFAVISSLHCEEDCATRDACFTACPAKRTVGGIPLVCGEVGGGAHGLYRTVPPAVADSGGAVVLGHGLFLAVQNDFSQAVARMIDIENRCITDFRRRMEKVL